MKNVLKMTVAALALSAFAGSAGAADLADTPSYWNGFYIGGQAGYYDAEMGFPGGGPNFSAGDGVAIGGYAGFNYDLGNSFVIGLEADYNAALGDISPAGPPFQVDSYGTVRARAGYAMGGTLLYATGGLAIIDMGGAFGGVPDPGTEIGFAVGGGIEHFLTQSISMKAEYLYMATDGFGPPFFPPGTDIEIHTLRGGVAFHF